MLRRGTRDSRMLTLLPTDSESRSRIRSPDPESRAMIAHAPSAPGPARRAADRCSRSPRALLSRLIWFDRSGQRLGAVGPIADHGNIELSPDGTRVAVAVTDGARASRDIWMYNIASGERTQFTSDPSDENWLIWSPDGARVLLNSFARDHLTLFEAPSSGASERTRVLERR